jgi:2-polyprenyl-3-methyl-5-hydroxy-6-metoxy-1,4-benzoquinol methylase
MHRRSGFFSLTSKNSKRKTMTVISLTQKSFVTFFGDPIKEPKWVNNRDANKVLTLHKMNSKDLFSLRKDYTLLDAGCGNGAFLNQVKRSYPSIKTIGISATPIDCDKHPHIDKVYYGLLPDARTLFADYAGQIDTVIDTMGVLTYSDNPIHILIALCSLLKKEGIMSIVSLGNHDESRLGDPAARELIKKFLYPLGMKLNTTFYEKPTHNPLNPTGLLPVSIFRVEAIQPGNHIANNLDYYFNLSDRLIGVPRSIDNKNYPIPDFPTKGPGSIRFSL